MASAAAEINCIVNGTPGSNDMPGALIFSTTSDGAASTTERMRIDSDGVAHFNGDVKVLTGDIQMGNGRGINFSPTSDATGMTSETLDDYEEGTWTPVSTATAFQQAYGTYTKVGNIVNAWFAIQVASSVNANYFQLNSLPFSYSNTVGGMSGGSIGLTDMDTNDYSLYVTGSSILLLNLTNNGYLRYNTYANKYLRGHVVYKTS